MKTHEPFVVDDRVDISEPLGEICRLLGLEPPFVCELRLTPKDAVAIVYRKDENGKKYASHLTGQIAKDALDFRVKTG